MSGVRATTIFATFIGLWLPEGTARATDACTLACARCDDVGSWSIPADAATGVPTNIRISLVAETDQQFQLLDPDGNEVALDELPNGGMPTRTFAPRAQLAPQTQYRFRNTNHQLEYAVITFTSGDAPDTQAPAAPTIGSIDPALDDLLCDDHVGLNVKLADPLPAQSLLWLRFTAAGRDPVEAYVPAITQPVSEFGGGIYLAYTDVTFIDDCMHRIPPISAGVDYQVTVSVVDGSGQASAPSQPVTVTPSVAAKTSERVGACGCASGAPLETSPPVLLLALLVMGLWRSARPARHQGVR